MSPEPTTTRRPAPLRSELGSDAYDVVDERTESLAPEQDPLRSELGSNAYDVIDERTGSISRAQDPLRSELGSNAYDVIDERTGSISREQDPLRSEADLAPGVGHDVVPEEQGPPEEIGPQFKMKSMEERYLKGEKQAPGSKVQINGEETTVQQKAWLRDQVNDERRKRGLPEVSKELWEKSGFAGMQANTQYFNEQQRAEHQVTLKDGALKGGDQNLQQGSHIFVMDGEGQLYTKGADQLTSDVDGQGRQAHVHHSSFLAGEEVAGAGEIRVGGDGALKEVTDRSGHYKPGEEQTKQTLEAIDQQGVSLDNVQFTLDRGVEDKTKGMAREFLQGQVTPEEQQHRAELQTSGKTVRDTSKAMEQTFKGRHNVADQIKAKGASVRDTLNKTDNLKGLEARAQEQGKKQGLGRVK